jgi:hypothetical protein
MLSTGTRTLFQRCVSTATVGHPKRYAMITAMNTTSQPRAFSGAPYGGAPNGPLRSQPQYAIFGEKTMLAVKVMPPVFRCLKNGSLVLDQNKKGRILLEWSPRGGSGKFYCVVTVHHSLIFILLNSFRCNTHSNP